MSSYRDWLEPLGDTGLYVTPNEPVEPWDCTRWSGSPICSTPISVDPSFIGVPTGGPVPVALTADPTTLVPDIFGISTRNVIRFSKPFSLSPEFSQDGCDSCLTAGGTFFWIPIPEYDVCYRAQECRNDPLPPPPPPWLPPPSSGWFFPGTYAGHPNCFSSIYITIPEVWSGTGEIFWNENGRGWVRGQVVGMLVEETKQIISTISPSPGFTVELPIEGLDVYESLDRVFSVVYYDRFGEYHAKQVHRVQTPEVQFPYGRPTLVNLPHTQIAAVVPFTREQTYELLQYLPPEEDEDIGVCFGDNPFPPPPPPHNPPRRPRENMCDCNNSDESNELLRLIAKRLGVNSYPVQVPKTLLGYNAGQSKLENITEFVAWQATQMDGLLGQFPITVKIEDSDATQAGNQEKTVLLHNVAETMAELYALSAKSSAMSDAHTHILMRLAAEAVTIHSGVAVNQDYVKAIASYLGFASNTPTRDLQFAFDVTKLDSLDTLLKTVTKKVVGFQDTDKNTLQDYLEKLMFAAGIIKTVFYRKSGQAPEIIKQIASILGTEEEGQREEDAWDNFIESMNNVNGLMNANQPTKPHVVDRNADSNERGGL
jgi:hypothetical protein